MIKPLTRVDATRLDLWQVAFLCSHGFKIESTKRGRLVLARPYRRPIRFPYTALYLLATAAVLGAYFVVSGL